jgi:RNA polymerase sigma factor (sigma-70 family)
VNEIHDIFMSLRLRIARAVSSIVPPHEVEDIVQETYVRLCQVGSTEHIQHPKSYLFKTARNLALDNVKRAGNRLSEHWEEGIEDDTRSSQDGVDEVFEQVASKEEFAHFCEAVRQLPVQARRVFVLKKVYGYSQREIASELGLSESTVEKHVALAVRRCATYMKEERSQQVLKQNQVNTHHE